MLEGGGHGGTHSASQSEECGGDLGDLLLLVQVSSLEYVLNGHTVGLDGGQEAARHARWLLLLSVVTPLQFSLILIITIIIISYRSGLS